MIAYLTPTIHTVRNIIILVEPDNHPYLKTAFGPTKNVLYTSYLLLPSPKGNERDWTIPVYQITSQSKPSVKKGPHSGVPGRQEPSCSRTGRFFVEPVLAEPSSNPSMNCSKSLMLFRSLRFNGVTINIPEDRIRGISVMASKSDGTLKSCLSRCLALSRWPSSAQQ